MVAEEKAKLITEGIRHRSSKKSYGSVSSVDTRKDEELPPKTSTGRCECVFIWVVLLLAAMGIIVGEVTLIPIALQKIEDVQNCLISSDPGVYPTAAVASDDYRCSDIGRDVLSRGGSAVDAAISTMLCIGVVVSHSSGIGGGMFMTIYKKDTEDMVTLNAREVAPEAATTDMFEKNFNLSSTGGLAVSVPGEIKGMWSAHQKFGRLPWSALFEGAIRLCREGAKVSHLLAATIQQEKESILKYPGLRAVLWNSNTSDVYKEGETLKMPKLGDTLERIALRGEKEFYTGETAKILVKDIQAAGGIVTEEDLEDYEATWNKPVKASIGDFEIYGPPPPSSSAIIHYIFNILDGYKLTPESIETVDSEIKFYHRLIEAFKFAYALKAELGDPYFVNVTETVEKLLSRNYADNTRSEIRDDVTHDPSYYDALHRNLKDSGTSHVSVMAPDGSSVSATTSINLQFGSKVLSPATGIILNNNMDDFAVSNHSNAFNIRPSPNNKIEPGKIPLSSMSPLIVVDKRTKNVTAIIGSSGGSRIPMAISQVALLRLWIGMKSHEAVAKARIYHQLYPNVANYEMGFDQKIVEGLKRIGHKIEMDSEVFSTAVNAVFKTDKCIRAASDPRKGGIEGTNGF